MSTAINLPETAIRKVTGLDFAYIRKLPVQLSHPSTAVLQLKQLRMMMRVNDHQLLVSEKEEGLAGFAALQYLKPFLLIKRLAVDRFALTRGIAEALEKQARVCAKTDGCAAVIVRAGQLSNPALEFYKQLGYRLDGNTLFKSLNEGTDQ